MSASCRECGELRTDDGCGCDQPRPFPFTFEVRGITYQLTVLDESPDVLLDPTLLLFRGDEEVAVITAHLDPTVDCGHPDHLTLSAEALEP